MNGFEIGSVLDYQTLESTMKALGLLLAILFFSIVYLDAFLPDPQPHHHRKASRVSFASPNTSPTEELPSVFTHDEILWKVRPPPETKWWKRLWLRFAANTIRLDSIVKRQDPPVVLLPKGQAVLEAHYKNPSSKTRRYQKIGRFGFTSQRGPPAPAIAETVQDLYGLNDTAQLAGAAAIIYMFVEPEYRKRNLGTLALQVISLCHAYHNCDFTMLVVDDDGSGKLIKWYEDHGFLKAPKLQTLLGSPGGVQGITMIAPTQSVLPQGCHIRWW